MEVYSFMVAGGLEEAVSYNLQRAAASEKHSKLSVNIKPVAVEITIKYKAEERLYAEGQ